MPQHVASIYGVEISQTQSEIEDIISAHLSEFRAKFRTKRQEAIKRYHADGGGPKTDELWPEGSMPSTEQIYGKQLEGYINAKFQSKPGGRKNLQSMPSQELIQELRNFIGHSSVGAKNQQD